MRNNNLQPFLAIEAEVGSFFEKGNRLILLLSKNSERIPFWGDQEAVGQLVTGTCRQCQNRRCQHRFHRVGMPAFEAIRTFGFRHNTEEGDGQHLLNILGTLASPLCTQDQR